MAANPPYEGAVLVLGTIDEVGIPLLEKADNPQDVVAYAGYGFWAPAALVKKTKGLTAEKEIETSAIAPVTGDQAIEVPTLDGDLADPQPQGDPAEAGDGAETVPAVPDLEPDAGTEADPTTAAVGTQPSKVEAETPAENTAAADPADPSDPAPAE